MTGLRCLALVVVGACSVEKGDGGARPDAGAVGGDLASPDMPPLAQPCTPMESPTFDNLIPRPVSVTPNGGMLCLPSFATITIEPTNAELTTIAQYLADRLKPATGYLLPIAGGPPIGTIHLTTDGADAALGDEGYQLEIGAGRVTLTANRPAGLFHGVQTLRQLLPAAIELGSLQPGPWPLPRGTIRDYPRFGWRGAMLDIARHFFTTDDVERYIDLLSYYKINRLHLHLTDDQGWRLAIGSWPNLTTVGGSSEVGGTTGAFFYTEVQWSALVAYAAQRYIVVIPEIDMPGHTNAALASYASLNCNGVAPPLYTGTLVGFSSLCIGSATVSGFVADVLGELANATPGPYLHIGGDEANSTNPQDYAQFIVAAQKAVHSNGKQMIGWADITRAMPGSDAIAQYWNPHDPGSAQAAVQQHLRLIMAPADHAYLDIKYDPLTPLGNSWIGYVDEQQAYQWDPATVVPGIAESDLLGVESPLWTETLVTRADLDYMAFPRLAGHAEIGWSPSAGRSWDEYKLRIAAHGPRLTAMGVNFYKSSRIPWQ